MGVWRPTAGGIAAVVGSVLALALWPSAAFGVITDVRNATIDGKANGSSSPPGGVLGATVTATVSGGSTWRATQVTFSTSPAESQCINHSDRGSGTASFNVTAPGTPNNPQTTGYDVTFTPSESNNCESGSASQTLIDGLRVTEPANNPNLQSRCGLNIMLVLDKSGSIDTSGATGAVKAATRAFLDALADTGSAISITDFSTTARQQVPYTVVTSGPGGSIESTFDPYIDNVYRPSGWTNWEDAFKVVRAANVDPNQPNADLVVFITDGDPTARNEGTGTVTGITEGAVAALRPAVAQADLVKGQGSHVFAMGVGAAVTDKNSARRLTAISGFEQYPQEPFRFADYTLVQDFDDLEAAMREIAAEMCGAGVTVTKYVDNGAGYVVDSGWDFTTRVRVRGGFSWVQPGSATGRSATVTTDGFGLAKFQWRPKVVDATSTIRSVRERPREGYSFVTADCQRDSVRRARRRTFTRTSLPIVRNVRLQPGEHMTCKVYNRINPGTIAITKDATPESSQAFDFTGSGALGNFTLVDDGRGSDTHSVDNLPPGSYSVSEIVPAEWELTGIACTPEGAVTITPPDVAITLAPGGSVACTFSDLGPSPPVPPEPPPTPPGPPTPPTPPPPTELVVVKTMPRVARVGRRDRFRLAVTNVGTVPALRVQLGDVPSASLALANLSASRQARVIRGNAIWNLGTLNPGETRTVRGTVRIQAGTPGWKRNLALATAVNANLARDTTDTRLIGGGVRGEQQGNAPPVTG